MLRSQLTHAARRKNHELALCDFPIAIGCDAREETLPQRLLCLSANVVRLSHLERPLLGQANFRFTP
jgi:hypothetical protein